MLTTGKKSIVISTLGPGGTCSENTAKCYLDARKLEGTIKLYDSFEEAIEALKREESDCALVPAAYQNFDKILFYNSETTRIVDTFTYETPRLIIGSKMKDASEIKKVAGHPAPSNWIHKYLPEAEVVFAKSSSQAAIMVAEGKVDACMTNSICIDEYGLNVIKDCGSILMSWNVFERRVS